jgi:bifunctional UDP-N-acetylglucosamine pyrophosphorylase/glucosamine-1-phosphate N-acetyltransferase
VSQPVSVVILAAGLGTRMKSRLAKVLHRAGGLYLVEHVIRTAGAIAPPERTAVVVGHQAERVREVLNRTGVSFVTQAEQKGTGHALLMARHLPSMQEGRIVVLYGDCPLLAPETLQGLLARHESAGVSATLITTILEDPTGYGRIYSDSLGRVERIIEEKACTPEQKKLRLINSGIYCFQAADLWQRLERVTPNPASGEIYLTDLVELMRAEGCYTVTFELNDPAEMLGINTRLELAQVDRILRARKTRQLMLNGVTIEKPETVTIDLDVQVGQDTVIGPFAQLLGKTNVGADCSIGASTILDNAILDDGVKVFPFTSIQDSTLDSGAEVGPFARLRMNAHIEALAHVGNFVELKKTRLGTGSKSMHLAYLGDSTIGAGANIGAGTITCNYDGVNKHPTTIGAGAFVGSNSTLVAPVEVGPGSYVAAGSVITDFVPADALALGRSRQVIKEGWAAARRARTLKK